MFDVPNDGYDLTTNFGPVFDITPIIQNLGGLNTDLGIFSLDSAADASFTAELKDNEAIGGTSFPVSTTTLLVAGVQANMGLWSLALVGVVAAGAAITYKLKSKKTEQ